LGDLIVLQPSRAPHFSKKQSNLRLKFLTDNVQVLSICHRVKFSIRYFWL
jgi:hypothetical protein